MARTDPIRRTYPIHEAKARFSEVVREAEAGEEIEITRHGKVVVKVVRAAPFDRRPGWAKGTVWAANDDWSFERLEFSEQEIDEMLADGDSEQVGW